MKGSVKIGKFLGIDVFIHWTFLILIAWIVILQLRTNGDLSHILTAVGFILVLFLCVTLHEYGHALAARRYGIKTKHITLLPIGGIAMLEKMPEKPAQELVVALAGPLVNFVIAAVLFIYLYASGQPLFDAQFTTLPSADNFVQNLLKINLALAVFNLIPAFPMDGGRVLRAILALKLNRVLATRIAARTGQFIAILFVFWGLFSNPFLVFIGIFIFLAAQAEATFTQTHSMLSNTSVSDVTMRNYTTLDENDTLQAATQELLNGQVSNFLVLKNSSVVGTLSKKNLIKGITEKGMAYPVKDFMDKNFFVLQPDMLLEDVYKRMIEENMKILPVYSNDKLIGAVDTENILEYVLIKNAKP